MDYLNLGKSGVKVSRIAMGGLTLGREADEAESQRMVDMAYDHGINFFDVANSYSKGRSEEVLGKCLGKKRNSVVLATKVFNPMGDGPNDRGGSRYHIVRAVEESLRRLKTDRIDLYQLHRYDREVPLEETLRALDDLVRWGKVVYIGVDLEHPLNRFGRTGPHGDVGLHQVVFFGGAVKAVERVAINQGAPNVAVDRCDESLVAAFVVADLGRLGGEGNHPMAIVDLDSGNGPVMHQCLD